MLIPCSDPYVFRIPIFGVTGPGFLNHITTLALTSLQLQRSQKARNTEGTPASGRLSLRLQQRSVLASHGEKSNQGDPTIIEAPRLDFVKACSIALQGC